MRGKEMSRGYRIAVTLLALSFFAAASGCGRVVAPTSQNGAATPAARVAGPASSTAASGGSIRGPFEGEAKKLNGAGATFPQPLYARWFEEYARLTGVEINYQGIGSGGGITSISEMSVDLGASDASMTDEQLTAAKGGEIYHVPMALGAVVATYNIPEVSTPLKFSPETLPGIFLGEIRTWNDPKLTAENPGVRLPDRDIVVVHRSDGSGTTNIFTDYLSSVSEKWQKEVGHSTSVSWPVGLGGQGNPGVAVQVKLVPYSIGYVELIYALQNKLGYGLVKNKSGNYIEPSLESVTEAAAGISSAIAPDLRASIVNGPGDKAYPISGFTWMLVYRNMNDKAKAVAVTRLLWWAIHDGQKLNASLGYAPLPEGIVKKAEEKVKSITVQGKPALPGQ
ncbi:MAG: phosphate ABC transporter substrate-binding protein PstS [Chloroflexi bacterium]|nr:phosphate ABC transporter substrate-binding protein PstS [Chloroflexota bacterium]